MSELVGVNEAGRRLGVHPSQISRGLRAGVIPNHGQPGKPLIDVEEARQAREAGIDVSKQRAPARSSEPSFQDARTRREQAQAEKAEIELRQLRRQTLDRAEVTDAAFAVAQMLREALETRRAALAQRLAGHDAPAILALLAQADDEHLRAFADAVENRFAAPENAVAA